MHYVAYVDFTKLGTFSQQNVNTHAQWLAHVLSKNPLRCSSIVFFALEKVRVKCALRFSGSIGVVIAPLLSSALPGSSLRGDCRTKLFE